MTSKSTMIWGTSESRSGSLERIDRLDAIRFVAAVWVAISHGALPLRSLFSDPIARLIAGGFESTFSGVSAVMVFFIVSGLCIHLPNADAGSLPVAKFLVRRYARIGVPLIVILYVTPLVGARAEAKNSAVLWSVYAELVYYSIYPVLFYAAKRWGWSPLVMISGFGSVCLTALNLDFTNVWEFGWLTWLWGLPIWLCGCLLAESLSTGALREISGPILAWRAAAWGGGAMATFALFHSPIRIGDPVSMLVFSFVAYCWLSKELRDPARTWQWLRGCGAASYSLYLVHSVVLGGLEEHLHSVEPIANVLFRCAGVAIGAYVFYKLVEAPSHAAARRLARAISFDVHIHESRRDGQTIGPGRNVGRN